MPLEKIVLEKDRAWAMWRITEEEPVLGAQVWPTEQVSDTITNPGKRLEWLAGRVLVKEVFRAMGLDFRGIRKDEYGKPYPAEYDYHLSLSHSFPFVAAILDKIEPVGIDLEQPKEKLLRIAHRVLHPEELRDAGPDPVKHCIYWCAKEALVKIHGQKNLVFAENLIIDAFSMKSEGDIRAKIVSGDGERVIPLHYIIYPNFVVVFNQRSGL